MLFRSEGREGIITFLTKCSQNRLSQLRIYLYGKPFFATEFFYMREKGHSYHTNRPTTRSFSGSARRLKNTATGQQSQRTTVPIFR